MISRYNLISEIGRGSFGTVYKATREDGKTIALKVIDLPIFDQNKRLKLVETIQNEVEQLKTLSEPMCNPFIICYYDSYYDEEKGQFLIEMEYVEGKDVGKFIDDIKLTKSADMVKYYILLIAKDLAEGLKYIHSKNIIHNDIKMENVMIDESFTPRIIDFGLACETSFDEKLGRYCKTSGGTPWYYSPDALQNKVKTPATDMWALGVLLYRITTGTFPYTLRREALPFLIEAIKNSNPEVLNTNNKQLNNVVNNLLKKNPAERWSPQDILNELKYIIRPSDSSELSTSKTLLSSPEYLSLSSYSPLPDNY